MSFAAAATRIVILCFSTLIPSSLPTSAHAEDIDTEHLFGFMIGTDVGSLGERELQSQTTGRFSKAGGQYRALNQELELEFVPANNFRIEVGSSFGAFNINGVPGLEDRRQMNWQGASLDLRYRFLDRRTAPFGLTFALETHGNRLDETTAEPASNFGTELTLAIDRELVPDRIVAAFNLMYEPEWTRFSSTGLAQRESTAGGAIAVMAQILPGFLIGGETRYLRKYEGVGLDEFAGQALFAGPTAYLQLSERSRLTFAWSTQLWGRPTASTASLDLVNFERHQARLIFGINF
ncbi:MAG TPA: hypothetical protein VJV58_09505 [Bradyrhizobium sp.]|uniref:hypothetical protein n=1 Tax=Bradyrhizobium sp. TaxID=376 RepID=UPI002B4786D6|nr:hypothetical protein [Bradyrhizobium sp.]HKO71153.1 hypothetical protein [Bradyrhizobium sp.]